MVSEWIEDRNTKNSTKQKVSVSIECTFVASNRIMLRNNSIWKGNLEGNSRFSIVNDGNTSDVLCCAQRRDRWLLLYGSHFKNSRTDKKSFVKGRNERKKSDHQLIESVINGNLDWQFRLYKLFTVWSWTLRHPSWGLQGGRIVLFFVAWNQQ